MLSYLLADAGGVFGRHWPMVKPGTIPAESLQSLAQQLSESSMETKQPPSTAQRDQNAPEEITLVDTYTTSRDDVIRILCVDATHRLRPVVGTINGNPYAWTRTGVAEHDPEASLIKKPATVVTYMAVTADGSPLQVDSLKGGQHFGNYGAVAILKITVRNGGKDGALDVMTEVLPV